LPRLTLPEPDIKTYTDGFAHHKDLLDRTEQGKHLSHLVETLDDPTTIAVDGAWGAGKSHFLKCWVGEHLKNRTDTEALYFDAFQRDYLNDPLIALTGALTERLHDSNSQTPAPKRQKMGETLRKYAPLVGRTALRIGVSTAIAAATGVFVTPNSSTENVSEAGAETLTDQTDDLINTFWQSQDGKRAAMKAFRDALEEFTEPDQDGKPTRRLVIVVDELDRCRPDFALNLLEIIKHFFDVNGVTFVLGTNLRAMQNHVIARYGAGIDAALYLQKFVSFSMRLGDKKFSFNQSTQYTQYYRDLLIRLGQTTGYAGFSLSNVEHLQLSGDLSLRGLQALTRLCLLTETINHHSTNGSRETVLVTGLLYLQAMRPDIIEKIRDRTIVWKDISETLNPNDLHCNSRGECDISEAWLLCFHDQREPEFWREHLGDNYDKDINSFSPDTPRQLYERYVGSISLDLIA